jgi:hypothetical protein
VIGEEKNKQAYIRNMMTDMEQAEIIEAESREYTATRAPKVAQLRPRAVTMLTTEGQLKKETVAADETPANKAG